MGLSIFAKNKLNIYICFFNEIKNGKIKTIKKAWVVYHDDMFSNNPNNGYPSLGEIPVVYAENRNMAKVCGGESKYFDMPNGEPVRYIDLKAKRRKGLDIVKYKGGEMKRFMVKEMEEENRKINERAGWLEKFDDKSCFYVQNGYVGNSVLWWAKGCSGYTTDIDKAERFSKKDIEEMFLKSKRDEDRVWVAEHVEGHIKKHVDGQYLSNEFCLY